MRPASVPNLSADSIHPLLQQSVGLTEAVKRIPQTRPCAVACQFSPTTNCTTVPATAPVTHLISDPANLQVGTTPASSMVSCPRPAGGHSLPPAGSWATPCMQATRHRACTAENHVQRSREQPPGRGHRALPQRRAEQLRLNSHHSGILNGLRHCVHHRALHPLELCSSFLLTFPLRRKGGAAAVTSSHVR